MSSETNPGSLDNYDVLEKIGEGAYGVVYRAKCKASNEMVAVKEVRVVDQEQGVPAATMREVTLLRELQHKNVVRLLDVVMTESPPIYLVFEYMTTDLREYMRTQPENKTLDASIVKKYIGQIVDAIHYCHRRRVLHRDLKPDNLLVDNNGDIKVADFGFCRMVAPPVRVLTREVGTQWYQAPEILLGAGRYSTPVDVWSIGCIFFELMTGNVLFRGHSEIDQLHRIFRVLGTPNDDTWPGVSRLRHYQPTFPKWKKNVLRELLADADSEAVDLLLQMLIYSPRERISAKDAATHPYLATIPSSK